MILSHMSSPGKKYMILSHLVDPYWMPKDGVWFVPIACRTRKPLLGVDPETFRRMLQSATHLS